MEISDEQYKAVNRMIDKLTDIVVRINTSSLLLTEQVNDLSKRVAVLEEIHTVRIKEELDE